MNAIGLPALWLLLSHATLVIGVDGRKRRVGVGWDGQGLYEVFFVEPGFEFAELSAVTTDNVVETVVHYLAM